MFDHDFLTDTIGVAISYGIYDVAENCGTLVVGISHDTSAFAAHAIAHWWHNALASVVATSLNRSTANSSAV